MRLRLGSRQAKGISAFLGVILAFDAAYAASSWTVGVTGSTGGEAKAASSLNLTITAVASPSPGNLLYPGSTGDVVASIDNPNPFAVSITALDFPASTVYAAGYTDSALSSAASGCTSSTSLVSWTPSTGSPVTTGTLTTPLLVGPSGSADDPLVVTLTGAATMGTSSPSGCEGVYFSMPALTGVSATSGTGTPTTSPATDSY